MNSPAQGLEHLELTIQNELQRLVEMVPHLSALTAPDEPDRARLDEIRAILHRTLDALRGAA
jgi:hypothetical protein